MVFLQQSVAEQPDRIGMILTAILLFCVFTAVPIMTWDWYKKRRSARKPTQRIRTVSEWQMLQAGASSATKREYVPQQPAIKPAARNHQTPSNDRALQQRLLQESVKAPVQEPVIDVMSFDAMWTKLINATHVLLVGETHSGKSTAARALLSERAVDDQICIIDPHVEPDDWGGLPVIGKALNYREIQYVLNVLLKEMKARYARRAEGDKDYPNLTIFMDELPAIMKHCTNGKEVLGDLLREARKVNMRLVLMTQSTRVKTLGIEGEGDVLNNLCWLALGDEAVKECKDAATLERPAAFEYKGVTKPVIVTALPGLTCKVLLPDVLWPVDVSEEALIEYESTLNTKEHKGSKWTEQHIKIAAALGEDPNISVRALARIIYPNSTGGGDYSAVAKKIKAEVEQVLGVPLEV